MAVKKIGRPKKDPIVAAYEQALRILASNGMAPTVTVELDEVKEIASAERRKEKAEASLEGVLLSLEKPSAFRYRECKRCGEMFGSNYMYVAYCSDNCRAKEFEATFGIKWSSKTQEERWSGEPPLVIKPEVITRLLPWAEAIILATGRSQEREDLREHFLGNQFDDSFVQGELELFQEESSQQEACVDVCQEESLGETNLLLSLDGLFDFLE